MRRWPRTLSGRLAVALNAALVLALAAFTYWDIQVTAADRVTAKRASLRDEAETLAHAVNTMDPDNVTAVQTYLDRVCSRMQSSSPGHYILVETEAGVLESTLHVAFDPGRAEVVRQAAWVGDFGFVNGHRLVAGMATVPPTTVYVAEHVTDIRRSMQRSMVRRVLGIVGVAIVLALVLNASVYVLVRRPVKRLERAVREVGRGDLGAQAPTRVIEELRQLSNEFNWMSQQLAAAEADRERRLDRAKRIQRKLFPRIYQAGRYWIDGFHEPADSVAGDYWDIIACPQGSVLVCMADASGHGVPAAMSAMMLKVLVTDAASCRADPADILAYVNSRYETLSLDDDFATMLILRFAPDGEAFSYASAGHEPAIFIRGAEAEPILLDATGPPIGIDGDTTWSARAFDFAAGDRVVMATDGVADAQAPSGERFGRDRLINTVLSRRDRPIDELIAHVRDTVHLHLDGRPSDDDMTAVGVERQQAAAEARDDG